MKPTCSLGSSAALFRSIIGLGEQRHLSEPAGLTQPHPAPMNMSTEAPMKRCPWDEGGASGPGAQPALIDAGP